MQAVKIDKLHDERKKGGRTGPFAWLIKFFHSIQYFFKNLFK